MTLIDDVTKVCRRLAPKGWGKLFAAHGLNIDLATPAALAKELGRNVPQIDRTLRGFEDFAADGRRGIEPGAPAMSLLYHALASPNVLNTPDGKQLEDYPTPAEIETVENYVFGVKPPTIAQLITKAKAQRLAVVVFAYEYRPASLTCHKRHADMVYSRTGIARVGTATARYQSDLRGYLPESEEDMFAIRVSPARYAAYLAARKPGNRNTFVPARFQDEEPEGAPVNWKPDDERSFWVPVHKLFSGAECLAGLELDLTLIARHLNEKVRRIQLALRPKGVSKKQADALIPRTPPFVLEQGLAELSTLPSDGAGLLVPVPHPRLVEPATLADGSPATFTVPKNMDLAFSSSEIMNNAPSYVHARTEVRDGVEFDLNRDLARPDVLDRVRRGGYQARHYLDFTADGWISASCPQLADVPQITKAVHAAYSLVTAPDFFPSCDQRQLTEWAQSNAVPEPIRSDLWHVPPEILSDQRFAPNVQIPAHPFAADEFTITALVPLWGSLPSGLTLTTRDPLRHSHLPDDAAGVFAPGWDVGQDRTTIDATPVDHLAAYRLGSPFPEDAKLCAALSTFWPAVAPDATREMEPGVRANVSGTVCPLTDEEIGQVGNTPWDGVGGPVVLQMNGHEFAEYPSFQHADYVRNALANRFSLRLTGRVEAEEYKRRVMAMAFCHLVLFVERTGKKNLPPSLEEERATWLVLSFQSLSLGAPELVQAQAEANTILPGRSYRAIVFASAAVDANNPNLRRPRVPIKQKHHLIVDPVNRVVLVRRAEESTWRRGTLLV